MNPETIFTLKINEVDREMLVHAAKAMADEYRHVSEQLVSRYLAAQFTNDAQKFERLANVLKNLTTRARINEVIKTELSLGNKINAIKYVREATSMGLKEAKEYVDNFDGTTGYGIGII